ncbi:putative RNA-directed DNA polymerase [Helianthus annuus]|uniref:RNA-directed DNA polymerase n=1 Tax=Helianthus annuus TaxID=4232 RepID=A0A9K3DQL1_HELAN|nr:putative RNA-directed DNA polymerase [Helianthus annuus]KAJ0640736.1 putative RNA-directed DNA polymerase [Helianthus annuus]
MHNYHRSYGPPRCAFKVDIQKAYDTVHWSFLKDVLVGFGFHSKFVDWIMTCVSTPAYSLCVNGEVHGYFKGRRGLRQGDPLSPYLFTLVMETLTCILQHASRVDSSFKFHNKCEKQRIINLCFADDLFLFASGDVHSASFIMDSLTLFTNMSGLVPSIQKSTAFFCNVSDHVREAILNVLPFEEGLFPVRYLGVPLISTRLLAKDCNVLVERMEKRIGNWKNKLLSFAGRLQLIISVLSALHVYWSSVFILPASIIKELEAKMRNFLWSQEASFHRGKAKVAWSAICVPKYEGGLGIRRVGDVNKALMASHAWSILNKRDSLWVAWIYSYRLKQCNFWTCRVVANCSWSWRKLLQIRPFLRNHIWSDLGDGKNTSAWYDYWSQLGPLANYISSRVITNAGFMLNAKVADVHLHGSWAWPLEWRNRFPSLNQLDSIHLQPNSIDRLRWKDGDVMKEFSSSIAWHSCRSREQEIDWVNIVWFAQCIPRHAFLMWLIMRRKLLTQDIILQWDLSRRKNMNMMCCLLYYENVDSHEHLFFECSFSSKVWLMVREKAGMANVDQKWSSIVSWLKARGRSKTAAHFVSKLVVGATAYVIWQERNARLFRNQTRPPDTIRDTIFKTIRYKLMGVKFRQCSNVARLRGAWGIGEDTVSDDGG